MAEMKVTSFRVPILLLDDFRREIRKRGLGQGATLRRLVEQQLAAWREAPAVRSHEIRSRDYEAAGLVERADG